MSRDELEAVIWRNTVPIHKSSVDCVLAAIDTYTATVRQPFDDPATCARRRQELLEAVSKRQKRRAA